MGDLRNGRPEWKGRAEKERVVPWLNRIKEKRKGSEIGVKGGRDDFKNHL